jgi:GT2 family glycosyltransferase
LKVSLIITTYNWKEALRVSLRSALCQKRLPDEILIGDDGSRPDTKEMIEIIAADSAVPIRHVWHEDDGFRLSMIRNKAIAAARCEYLIFIDGDILLHPLFVDDHLSMAEKGRFFIGRRVLAGQALSQKILQGKNGFPSLLTMNLHHRKNTLRIPFITNFCKQQPLPSGKGCGSNMAFWKKDAINVNGFDEDFTGWGREDNDFTLRLTNAGICGSFLKFIALTTHLYHKKNSREHLGKNDELFAKTAQSGKIRCEKGVDQYLPELQSVTAV